LFPSSARTLVPKLCSNPRSQALLGNEELGNEELGNEELGNEELGNEELGTLF